MMTALLWWYVPNFVMITSLQFGLVLNSICVEFELQAEIRWLKLLVKWALALELYQPGHGDLKIVSLKMLDF